VYIILLNICIYLQSKLHKQVIATSLCRFAPVLLDGTCGDELIRRTPARSPNSCRLREEAVKKAVAASCSGEGCVATSMKHSTPSRACAAYDL
jgi:hypothetical protein